MTIATPEVSGLNMIRSIRQAKAILNTVRDGNGDLPIDHINEMLAAFSDAELALLEFGEDLAAAPALAMQYLSDRGGPSEPMALQIAAAVVKPAMEAWRGEIGDALALLAASDVCGFVGLSHSSGQIRNRLQLANAIPASAALAVRQSSQLTTVRDALTDLGF